MKLRQQALKCLSDYLAREGDDMTLNQFQVVSSSTVDEKLSYRETLEHALYGLGAECGEVLSIFQKQLQGHKIDAADLREELGDVMWFVATLCSIFGWTMAEVAHGNVQKRNRRYPGGRFDPERSVNREV